MLKRITVLFVFLIPLSVFAQPGTDTRLKRQLDSLMVEDQRYREYMSIKWKGKAAYDSLWALQSPLDSMNLVFAERIIKTRGYPGKSMVGEPANETVWYIIQHSRKIKEYFPVIKQAGEKGELPRYLVAKMEDRLLMWEGKEQLYGTQWVSIPVYDIGGNQIGISATVVWPIKDPDKVNERRKQAGFVQTVEQDAASMGVLYEKKLTVEKIKSLERH